MSDPTEKPSTGPVQRHMLEIAIGAFMVMAALATFVLPDLRNRAVAIFTRGAVTKMTVVGRVTDDKGGPVSGATIQLEGMGAGKSLTATTDARGEYRINSVDVGLYQPTAAAPGFVRETDFMGGSPLSISPGGGSGKAVAGGSKSRIVHDVRLKPGCSMLMKLTDEAGKPVTGATFVLHNPAWEPFGGKFEEQITDRGDGSYLIDGLPPETSPYQFIAVHPDYVPSQLRQRMDKAGVKHEAELKLSAGVAVHGTVQDEKGDPVEGIEVSAKPGWWPQRSGMRESMRQMRASMRAATRSPGGTSLTAVAAAPPPPLDPEQLINSKPSGADGKFTIPHVAPGTYMVMAITRKASGGMSASGSREQVLPPPDGNLIVRHRRNRSGTAFLEPGKLRGGVVDSATGQPVKKFSTRLVVTRIFGSRGVETSPDDDSQEHTPQDGTFEVELPPQSFASVQVLAEGMGEAWTPDVVFNPPGEPVSVKLSPGAKLAGRVLAPDGGPIVGAKVIPLTRIQREQEMRQRGGPSRLPVEELIPVHPGGAAETDTQGRFTLDHLAPGPVGLRILHADFTPLDTPAVTLAAGQAGDAGDLTMSTGDVVEGYLLDGSGRAITGEAIAARDQPQPLFATNREYARTTTDSRGYFRLDGLPIKKLVVFRDADPQRSAITHYYSLVPTAGQITSFQFGHGESRVTGRLLTNGEPLRGSTVLLGLSEIFRATTATDNEGRFEFHGVPPGRHSLVYRIEPLSRRGVGFEQLNDHGRHNVASVVEVAGKSVELGDIDQKLGTLTLKVIEDPDRPIVDGWVSFRSLDGSNGSFHGLYPQRDLTDLLVIDNLPTGDFQFDIHGSRNPQRFSASVHFDPAATTEPVEVDFRPGTATLRVKSTGPAAGYAMIREEKGGPADVWLRPGEQVFEKLRAGRYAFYPYSGPRIESIEPIELAEGETKSVEVVLPGPPGTPGSITVLVLDERGFVISQPDVRLHASETEHTPVASQGSPTQFVVPSGGYTLHVAFPGFEPVEQSVTVGSVVAAPPPVIVRLKRP